MYEVTETNDDRKVPQEASNAAADDGLGQPRDCFVLRQKKMFGGSKRAVLAEFEHGVVCHEPGMPPAAYRWEEIASVTQNITDMRYNGAYTKTIFKSIWTFATGSTLTMEGSYMDPKKHPRATPGSSLPRFAGLLDYVAQRVVQAKLPQARATLEAGGQVTFDAIVISRQGVETKAGVVPWASIRGIGTFDGWIRVLRNDRTRPIASAAAMNTPDSLLLFTLAHELRAKAQGA